MLHNKKLHYRSTFNVGADVISAGASTSSNAVHVHIDSHDTAFYITLSVSECDRFISTLTIARNVASLDVRHIECEPSPLLDMAKHSNTPFLLA